MTVQDAYEKLEKLMADGHGELRLGYFDHEYDQFNEIDEIEIVGEDFHHLGLKDNEQVAKLS